MSKQQYSFYSIDEMSLIKDNIPNIQKAEAILIVNSSNLMKKNILWYESYYRFY